ncbi:MAG: sodium-translocating pyrophosphatase [Patescibacteria group bacterium]|nr:sodium-translocating pyrophosphatase [Patescibacteria group bacterium]MDE2438279.1 sodium-translocating pyrophosphatase [Patescibacteria group bacterium]
MNYLPLGVSALGILYSVYLIQSVLSLPAGDEKMKQISHAVQEGSEAYLARQNKAVFVVAVVIAIVLWFTLGTLTTLGFIVGAFLSGLAGYLGMNVAVRANARTTEAAKQGMQRALDVAFKGGAVTGVLVVSLGLLAVSGYFMLTHNVTSLVGLGFGASLISTFARLGGGIFTKSADVGADLVGKVEAGLPEDDPRNPAVIADNVGDNVGDCAGMAADLFETYTVTIIAAMLLTNLIFPNNAVLLMLPFQIGALAIIASILGLYFVKLDRSQDIMRALYKGLLGSAILAGLFFAGFIKYFLGDTGGVISNRNIFFALLIGLLVTALIVWITDYYTAKKYKPVQHVAEAANSGHGTNVIMGLAVGLEATVLPVFIIVAATLLAFHFAGLYGIALAVLGMLSLTGIVVAIDSFGPITDNAGGIAEMTQQPESVRTITDALDAVGNTTKAVTKGYAIASAGLAALVLFSSYIQEVEATGHKLELVLQDPWVLAGILIGASIPYLFASIAMRAVSKTAQSVVHEVRTQLKENPNILEGKELPDYARTVDIVTKAALKEMSLPALIPIASVILVGLLLGAKAVGGLLIGTIITGIFLALSMTTGGAAWDNAKKYIEEGHFGGKKSPAHQAAVTGDTVGDVYKDTAGPAINPMIKVVNIVALLLVRFLK